MLIHLSENRLKSIVCETLEEATLMLVEPVKPGQAWPEGLEMCAWLECVGPYRLGLQLRASRAFVQRSGINMIGLDPEVSLPDEQVTDTIRELANIVVGRLVVSIFGQQDSIQVGIPVATETARIPREVDCTRVKMLAGDRYPVELTLWARD